MPEKQYDKALDSSFGNLLYGLNASALLYLGLDEQSNVAPNLALAQENIAIIATLKEKTKGNLDATEECLINEILSDLRLKYARLCENQPQEKQNKLEESNDEA